MANVTAACLLSVLVLGCAAGQSPPPTGVPATEVGARRVVEIFQHRHLRPHASDDTVADALLDRVRNSRSAEERARMFDAFAKAHDPHSAYLTSDALARLRSEIHQPDPDVAHVRGRMVEHQGTRIAVMVIPSFYLHADRSTSRDAAYVAQQLITQGAEVIVVDMRGNTGGVQSEAITLVSLFAGPGPVAQIVAADGDVEVLRGASQAIWDGPLLIAVDAMSASMTEVAAAALQDRGRALVAGQHTHGKGTGQTLVLLSSPHGGRDGAVRVTDRRFHRLDGRPLQQLGVTPDVELPGLTGVTTERERTGALTFDPVPAIDTPTTHAAPASDTPPIAAALAWLRTEAAAGWRAARASSGMGARGKR